MHKPRLLPDKLTRRLLRKGYIAMALLGVVLIGACSHQVYKRYQAEKEAEKAAELATLPRFVEHGEQRLDNNRTIEVRAEVQGERTGGYTFGVYVLNFMNEVTYSNTQSVSIGAYPYTFTHRIDAVLLGELMRTQYKLDDNTPFCEPVRLLITLSADNISQKDYYAHLEWRANVDVCTFGDTYIPPQNMPPADAAE